MRSNSPQLCPFTGLSCPFLVIPDACPYFLEYVLPVDTALCLHFPVFTLSIVSAFHQLIVLAWVLIPLANHNPSIFSALQVLKN